MYRLLRPFLFLLDAEKAHNFTLWFLKKLNQIGLSCLFKRKRLQKPTKVMGIEFPNPVGLAAGLDKNAEYVDVLAKLGFGFVEVGTVTPKPQAGNPKPRLFRLTRQNALINRMGFNNQGLDRFIENCKKIKSDVVLGINLGKNTQTPLDAAIDDYLLCFEGVHPYADYIAVNVSSPNSPGLRDLQHGDYLTSLLKALKAKQAELALKKKRYVPLVVKVAPDLTEAEIDAIAAILIEQKIDGLIVGNTTLSRPGLDDVLLAKEKGGLSGQPLFALSTRVLEQFHRVLQGKVALIGLGGIMQGSDARGKFQAGAQLVQVYTGLIYQGPRLVRDVALGLSRARHPTA